MLWMDGVNLELDFKQARQRNSHVRDDGAYAGHGTRRGTRRIGGARKQKQLRIVAAYRCRIHILLRSRLENILQIVPSHCTRCQYDGSISTQRPLTVQQKTLRVEHDAVPRRCEKGGDIARSLQLPQL